MPSFIKWSSVESLDKNEEKNLKISHKSMADAELRRRLEKEFASKSKKLEYLKEELTKRQDRLVKERLVLMNLRQKYAMLTNIDLGIISPPRIIKLSSDKEKLRHKSSFNTKLIQRQRVISTKVIRLKYGMKRRSLYNINYSDLSKNNVILEDQFLEYLRGYKDNGTAGKDLLNIAKEIVSVATTTTVLAFKTVHEMRNVIEILKNLEFGAGIEAHVRETDSIEARLLEFRLNIDQLIQNIVHDVALLILHNNLTNFVSTQVEDRDIEKFENANELKNFINEVEIQLENFAHNLLSYDKQLTRIKLNITEMLNEFNSINKWICEYLKKDDKATIKLDYAFYNAYKLLKKIINNGEELINNDTLNYEEIFSHFVSTCNQINDFSPEEDELFQKIEELMTKYNDLKLRLSADKYDRKWFLKLIENNKEETWNLNLEIETQRRQNIVAQLLKRIKTLQESLLELTNGETKRMSKIEAYVEREDITVAKLLKNFNIQCELELKQEECHKIKDQILLGDPLKAKIHEKSKINKGIHFAENCYENNK